MAVFFLNIRVLNFMRNPKLAHILVSQIGERIVLADFLTNIVMLIYIDYWRFSCKRRTLELWKLSQHPYLKNECDIVNTS